MPSAPEKEPVGQALSTTRNKELSFSQKRHGELIQDSVETILKEQHPLTGFFPAATSKHHVKKDDYHRSWVRDNSLVANAFCDSVFLKIFPVNSELGNKAVESASRFLKGMLNLASCEPWKSAFNQETDSVRDTSGRVIYRVLTKEAPPIHFETNGKPVFWIRQNQPDSWGEFLISLGHGLKQNLLSLDVDQQKTVESITGYLSRIKISELEQSSMWEDCPVHDPVPLSSVVIVAKGLELISPFVSKDLSEPIRRTVSNARKFAEENYPKEYTIPFGHESETDLATLVAHGLGALDGFSISRYFIKSYDELGDGQWPGKKRFKGDRYYPADEESVWPMGALLEAKIFLEKAINLFEKGSIRDGKMLQARGLNCLERVVDLKNHHGYSPELLMKRDGEFIPNNNHLLWNEALQIQTCARAIIAENLNPATAN